MGKHRTPTAPHRSFVLRPATVLLGGAMCVAVVGTTPALADDQPFTAPIAQLPVGPVDGGAPLRAIPFAAAGFGAPVAGPQAAAAPVADPVAPAVVPAATAIDEPVPPAPAAPPVANDITIGSVSIPRPDFVPAETAAQINQGSADVENGLSTMLDSTGMDPARSDVIAERVIGDAAIGAVVANTVASPISSAGAMVGAAAGFIAGIPFLPAGLVVMPVIGAVLGYAFVAAPAVAVGALIGAGVGAIEGSLVPVESAPAAQ
ncbi:MULTISPECIES: hypothetical protein [Nocardia]|uniref:Uncharacterized protein n=1 Tax=Nocardia farcinica (strain IFM 10152) TaxID=247156 RepID=Q5YPW4_NOCFA|nr:MULTISPECIES: hypothetical protein [Nocardia]MBF6188774.1 hypothetical protein [Nocardia farcinica]MBF6313304.1 hypothetical protein [Nocardia farcinica]MBF6409673.1 hypothetical protein [Nocardia farcinica]PEH77648.1 hypothetical protein CRM89_18045 [Nocardia sp. FDAARGOS_372]PFX01203.1 hypothetical protein CJ469_04016 [Nocardia farcinica]